MFDSADLKEQPLYDVTAPRTPAGCEHRPVFVAFPPQSTLKMSLISHAMYCQKPHIAPPCSTVVLHERTFAVHLKCSLWVTSLTNVATLSETNVTQSVANGSPEEMN